MRRASRIVLAFLTATASILAQTTAAPVVPLPGARPWDVNLYGVSFYSGYYSSGAPTGGADTQFGSALSSGPGANSGIAATIGGSYSDSKSMFSWSYSPSYFNMFYLNNQLGSNGSLSQRMSANLTRSIGSRWTLTVSLSGMLANLQQLYFSPGVLSSVSSASTTFDNLAAGVISRQSTDPQVGPLLNGAQLLGTPEQGYLYGRRLLDVAATTAISWAPSGRTSVSLTAAGTRTQSLGSTDTNGASAGTTGFIAPDLTNASLALAASYSLSPRTQISGEVLSNRVFSMLEQGYSTTASISLGRTLSRRWFTQVKAGAGQIMYTHSAYAVPKSTQYLFGGTLGYKTMAHTFLASYDRSLGDMYGLGSGTTSAFTGAWNWNRPGSAWALSAHGGYQNLNNLTFRNTASWQTGVSLSRSLGGHMSVSAQYMYLRLPGDIRTIGLTTIESGVMVGMNWSPLLRF